MTRAVEERWRLPLSRLLGLVLFVVCAVTESGWDRTYPLVTWLNFTAGCILVAIGSMGRLWCSLYIAGYKTGSLITEGPYSMCRHPLYFFSAIAALGVGLATETWTLAAAVLAAFAAGYPSIMRAEEARMLRVHGAAWEAYASATPRFFPRLSLLREPEIYSTHPRTFRRHLMSALWFIWFIGLLELAEGLRETGVYPAILRLY